jgi:hypothetical protein
VFVIPASFAKHCFISKSLLLVGINPKTRSWLEKSFRRCNLPPFVSKLFIWTEFKFTKLEFYPKQTQTLPPDPLPSPHKHKYPREEVAQKSRDHRQATIEQAKKYCIRLPSLTQSTRLHRPCPLYTKKGSSGGGGAPTHRLTVCRCWRSSMKKTICCPTLDSSTLISK